MYVLEYFIYHLRPYGVDILFNTSGLTKDEYNKRLEETYIKAITNMGPDDVFKKNATDVAKLLELNSQP
jgi:hypothetical protein